MEKTISRSARRALIAGFFFCLLSINSFAQGNDINWLRQIYSSQPRSTDGLFKVITNTNDYVCATLPVAELVYGYAAHDSAFKYRGWQATAGILTNLVFTKLVKMSVKRDRPYVTHPDIIPFKRYDAYSFPSGHTSSAFETATTLCLQFPKWYIVAPSLLWAGAVGYSRLYLGMHYPSDVLAGALVGAGAAYLSFRAQKWLSRTKAYKLPNKF